MSDILFITALIKGDGGQMTVNRILTLGVIITLSFLLSVQQADARNKGTTTVAPSVSSKSQATLDSEERNNGDAETIDQPGNPPPTFTGAQSNIPFLSDPEFYLALIVALLALIAFLMEFILLRKIRNLKADDMLRVFAVTLVIFGTLFFVTVGFGAQQIAPAIGLFGTIAGYLLGKTAKGGKSDDVKDDQ